MTLEEIERRISEFNVSGGDFLNSNCIIGYVNPNIRYIISLGDTEHNHSANQKFFKDYYKIKMPQFERVDTDQTFQNILKYCKENNALYYTFPYYFIFFEHFVVFLGSFDFIALYSETPEIPDYIYDCIAGAKEENVFGYVVKTDKGFESQIMEVKNVDVDLSLQYNDSLPHDKISNFINSDSGGIAIFHGTPGCGKTTYIRHLISSNTNVKFQFLDSSIFAYIMDPAFIRFLLDNKNCTFILEDCEDILASRTSNRNSLISGLLNISDGIIGDSLNIKFICTFNSDLSSIDPALLRKGRLKIKYEFDKLNKGKAQKLIDSLGKEYVVTEPMALCDIYNLEENNGVKQKKKIGF